MKVLVVAELICEVILNSCRRRRSKNDGKFSTVLPQSISAWMFVCGFCYWMSHSGSAGPSSMWLWFVHIVQPNSYCVIEQRGWKKTRKFFRLSSQLKLNEMHTQKWKDIRFTSSACGFEEGACRWVCFGLFAKKKWRTITQHFAARNRLTPTETHIRVWIMAQDELIQVHLLLFGLWCLLQHLRLFRNVWQKSSIKTRLGKTCREREKKLWQRQTIKMTMCNGWPFGREIFLCVNMQLVVLFCGRCSSLLSLSNYLFMVHLYTNHLRTRIMWQ